VRAERGSVVAEFAIALPAVLLVLATLLAGVQVASAHLRAQDAAADAARSWARGDSSGAIAARVRRQLPGASVQRSVHGDLVCATVRGRPQGPLGRLGVAISAEACALAGGR
jgi:hypothetical protein